MTVELTLGDQQVFVHTGGGELDPSSGVIMLIHGAGNDHTIWRFVTRRLAAGGFPVVAPDLPAHGKTSGPALESIESMSEWCWKVVDELGAEQATLIGHSMGSLITMQMTVDEPGRVRAAGLFATAERMAVHPDLQRAADELNPLAADLIVGWSHTGRSRFGHHTAPGVWMAGSNRRLLERNAGSLGCDLVACSTWDGAGAFAELHVPTMIVEGERDRMAPSRAARPLYEHLPHAVWVEVPGGSHASLYDHPEAVVGPLVTWLEGLRARPVGRD